MKNKYRILKILVTVLLLGFLLSFSLKRFSNQKMTDEKVSVKMNDSGTPVYFISENEIKELVKKSNPSGKIGDIDIPKLEKQINSIPFVDSANVYLNLNGNLNLDIKQRVPVFRLKNGEKDFYVDAKGVEFPVSRSYSHTCMLVTGKVKPEEYKDLVNLVKYIDKDDFSKKYFIGITKEKGNYNLLTSEGSYKVELGSLENIQFKVKGFKTFVEKFLVYQAPEKYSKISVKYDNQIVTTLNPYFKENDSIIQIGKKELAKAPEHVNKKEEAETTASAEKKKKTTSESKKAIPEKPKEKKQKQK
ncbi:MAG: cell division protein FtsQ [Bergeyella sp.]